MNQQTATSPSTSHTYIFIGEQTDLPQRTLSKETWEKMDTYTS